MIRVQDDPDERPSIFRFLFGRGRDLPPEPPPGVSKPFAPPPVQSRPRRQRQPRQAVAKPKPEQAPARRVSTPRRVAAPAAPREPPPVEKAADAKRVLVIGDFVAGSLVKGLTEEYAQDPAVVTVDGSKGSSGLVRTDYHNWPGELPALVDTNKPDAIVVMVGSNDRQPIDTPTASVPLGSDEWKAAYANLVANLADALKKTGKPIVWVGLAPVRSSVMSRDYSTINGILREQLDGKGLKFIDAWNGFADEDGKYVSVGPDVTGQSVQLRASDGINFTRAGQRKLAYFAEQDLNDLLKGTSPLLATAEPAAAGEGLEPAEQPPRIGPMLPLDSVAMGGAASLSTSASPPGSANGDASDAIAKRLAGDPTESTPVGRADDFAWPPKPAPPPQSPPASAVTAP